MLVQTGKSVSSCSRTLVDEVLLRLYGALTSLVVLGLTLIFSCYEVKVQFFFDIISLELYRSSIPTVHQLPGSS